MGRTFEIVLWSFNLEAANLKYHNCCNKNFANFKGLEESKADRILTEVTAFIHFTHVSSCNSRVVIDHKTMKISLNLADFRDFFLTETFTNLPSPFDSLY